MKKIDPPRVDDILEVSELSLNPRLASYPELGVNLDTVKDQYEQYLLNSGDPFLIRASRLPESLKQAIRAHYERPPSGRLDFIDKYRRDVSPDVCPMCGSLGTGTLDHYLPKTDYAEFAIFSMNLIPSCNCNSLRNTTVMGNAGERVIHPYFDEFTSDRLYKSVFNGDFFRPVISVELCDPAIRHASILQFHLKEVVIKNHILRFLDKQWGDLVQRPRYKLQIQVPHPDLDTVKNKLV